MALRNGILIIIIVGWTVGAENQGFGSASNEPSIKRKLLELIGSIRTFLRRKWETHERIYQFIQNVLTSVPYSCPNRAESHDYNIRIDSRLNIYLLI